MRTILGWSCLVLSVNFTLYLLVSKGDQDKEAKLSIIVNVGVRHRYNY
jgi:hypothetical protein